MLRFADAGRAAWRSIVADPGTTLLCLDFDGVLSPIVADPSVAWASEDVMTALERVAPRLAKVAVVTGRPARQAVRLGRLSNRRSLPTLSVLGLYGFERWDAATDSWLEPDAPPAVEAVTAELPALLAELGLPDARVEDKRLAVAVHTRELSDPAGAFERLREPLDALARHHGLAFEPGRFVLELRAAGLDKGDAVRGLVAEVAPRVVVYAGDDLGDIPAFEAVAEMRAAGNVEALLVCSGSDEQDALVGLADVVVDGPAGVASLLAELAADLDA